MGKNSRRKGSSKAGRPPKAGERFSCGKLKPEKPHVVDYLTRAAHDYNPLGLAAAISLVTPRMQRAGEGFARIYRLTGHMGSRVANSGLHEVEERTEWRGALSTMPDEILVAAFDRVFSVFADEDERRTKARRDWRRINRNLTPQERSELISICVVGDTPFWLLHTAQGRELSPGWAARREAFAAGIRKVCAWFIAQSSVPEIIPLPQQRVRAPGPKVLDRTEYVSATGELLYVAERKISRPRG